MNLEHPAAWFLGMALLALAMAWVLERLLPEDYEPPVCRECEGVGACPHCDGLGCERCLGMDADGDCPYCDGYGYEQPRGVE